MRSAVRGHELVCFALLLAAGAGAHASPANSGFDADLSGWTSTSGAVDATIIDSPGDDCGAYLAYEQITCDAGNVIAVITGQKMVRLGSPKVSSESQAQTPVTLVSDPFTADSVTLAARLFSYEFRGDDQFIVDVIGEFDENPVANVDISVDFGTAGSCTGNPCEVTIDIGGRSNKKPFDSATLGGFNGAQDITIESLPDTNVRLRYSLKPSNNEAHPTWVYLDNRNSPPIPAIQFGPGDPNQPVSAGISSPAAALEGDFVTADCTASVDPEGDELTCNWKAWGGGIDASEDNPLVQTDTPVGVFYFPDSTQSSDCVPNDPVDPTDCPGYPTIELEVSDGQAPPQTLTVKVNLRPG
jgi:hypothetical protein